MHYLIMLLGVATVVLLLGSLGTESRRRKEQAARLMHTQLVSLTNEIEPVTLDTTQVYIGRLPSNDICLERIDPQNRISRIHCILWWTGNGFRIAPKYTTRIKNFRIQTSRPVVLVSTQEAPPYTGLPVEYENDVIEICKHRFKLVNTAPQEAPRPFSDMYATGTPQQGFPAQLRRVLAGLAGKASRNPRDPRARKRSLRPLLMGAAALVLVIGVALSLFFAWLRPPTPAESAIGSRKEDTATVLVCGTDQDGERTDTIMLCMISGEDRRLSILSLPRDLRTTTKSGKIVRLNAVYANGGAEGMEDLMDNVALFTGYRPDGYVVFNWDLVENLVDRMGGVTVTLQYEINIPAEGYTIHIPTGEQHLNGEQALATLRQRDGYDNADIDRVAVQRDVVLACLDQWVTPSRLPALCGQAGYVLDHALTDLSLSNMLWFGSTFMLNRDEMEIVEEVVPRTPVWVNGAYKGERAELSGLLELLNTSFNPFDGEITEDMLFITQ